MPGFKRFCAHSFVDVFLLRIKLEFVFNKQFLKVKGNVASRQYVIFYNVAFTTKSVKRFLLLWDTGNSFNRQHFILSEHWF